MLNVSLIKYLHQAGYRQKLICLITGYNQSIVSKHIKNPRPYIPTLDTANDNQLRRKAVIDRILQITALKKQEGSNFTQNDRIYIRLLEYMLVERDRIKQLYYMIEPYKISSAYRAPTKIVYDFKPEMLEIPQEEWDLLIEQMQKWDDMK